MLKLSISDHPRVRNNFNGTNILLQQSYTAAVFSMNRRERKLLPKVLIILVVLVSMAMKHHPALWPHRLWVPNAVFFSYPVNQGESSFNATKLFILEYDLQTLWTKVNLCVIDIVSSPSRLRQKANTTKAVVPCDLWIWLLSTAEEITRTHFQSKVCPPCDFQLPADDVTYVKTIAN